jgi:hypothetical protein
MAVVYHLVTPVTRVQVSQKFEKKKQKDKIKKWIFYSELLLPRRGGRTNDESSEYFKTKSFA